MKLLLIEDENQLAKDIYSYLNSNEVLCEWVNTIDNALNKISVFEYDCILLDLTLPDGNGIDFLQTLKKNQRKEGVIIISAKNSLENRLEGLHSGADDYLTKPFYIAELLARVQAVVRRTPKSKYMSDKNLTIPYYREINDFLQDITSRYRTDNPNFYCLSFRENEPFLCNYKPPFRKDFYFIALVSNAGKTKITYDNTSVTELNSFLVFQSPGLIYSFHRDNSAYGYLIYFKKECFSFFKPDFEKEFPFFNLLHTSFFKLNQKKFQEIAPHFEEVCTAYQNPTDVQHKIASVKMLALLYQLKDFSSAFCQWEEAFTTPQQILFQKFIQLVNTFYIEKRTIEEYAQLLNVTPNHLSQSVKSLSQKNALSYINERLLAEAKSLIQFTEYDIAEIAYHLNFSDPPNFGKFFKKHTGLTPLQFRKKSRSE